MRVRTLRINLYPGRVYNVGIHRTRQDGPQNNTLTLKVLFSTRLF